MQSFSLNRGFYPLVGAYIGWFMLQKEAEKERVEERCLSVEKSEVSLCHVEDAGVRLWIVLGAGMSEL